MNTRELTRAEVMQRLKDKSLTQHEAARQLNLSVRQVKRLWRAYKRGGPQALISRKRNSRRVCVRLCPARQYLCNITRG